MDTQEDFYENQQKILNSPRSVDDKDLLQQ